MRTRMLLVLLLPAMLMLAACGGDDDREEAGEAVTALTDTGVRETVEGAIEEAEEALEEALTFDLVEQNGSGISGTVQLTPTSEGDVDVVIELDGSEGGPHPAHIHEGSCADLDPEPKWPLEDVTDGRSETKIDVSAEELSGDEYAVNVHESAENADVYVACADIHNQ